MTAQLLRNGRFGHKESCEDPAGLSSYAINKRHIAASFSAAAETYDAMAAIQKDVGINLLNFDKGGSSYSFIGDIGCGTGWLTSKLRFSFPGACLLGMDLARGMIDYAAKHQRGIADGWWVADMEALPVISESFDMLYSNLAMQWLPDPEQWIKEAFRVLLPGGRLLCSTLLPGTLYELDACWEFADRQIRSTAKNSHINRFCPKDSLMQAARIAGFNVDISSYQDVRYYASVRALMAELKGIGAHNINHNRPQSVTGKGRIRVMLEHYEQFRDK